MTHKNTIEISNIIDENGDQITSSGIAKDINIDDLYKFCNSLKSILEQIPYESKCNRSELATLITRIKVAYYYKKLQEGTKLKPISLKNNVLKDGRRRLIANILYGNTEIEFTNTI